jgi:ketosteroid isomerase-like protein
LKWRVDSQFDASSVIFPAKRASIYMSPPALSRISSPSKAYDDVKKLLLEALRIIRSDDFTPYFDLFSDDAVWMMPSSLKDSGKKEAESFYGSTKKFRFDQEIAIEELNIVDDMAYVRVSFDSYLRAKNDSTAPPLRSVSRHLWILRKQPQGEWKITRDIWNNPKIKP